MTDLMTALQARLGDRFRIERELGGGGMSRVFLAEEVSLGRRVVLKVLPPDASATVNAERFRREVQTVARLQHPGVVPVHSTGSDAGALWYSMPFVEGDTLRARLSRGPMSVREALAVWRDVLEALSHAHASGVVHRDIKPENVLLSGRRAVVTDFGIARALATATNAEGGATLTGTGFVIGTPAYMAPEQAAGDGRVDARTDLYSAALVAYEMFTGHAPFASMSAVQAIAAQVGTMPAMPRTVRGDVPPAVESLLMQCLAKDPAARPPSAAWVLDALDALDGLDARHNNPSGASSVRRTRLGGAIAATLAIAALIGGAMWWQRRAAPDAKAVVPDLIVLASFTHAPADSSIARALTEALRIDLGQSPKLRVVDPQVVRNLLQAMRQPAGAVLSDSLARELAQRAGAKAVVTGSVTAVGNQYAISAHLVSAVDGSEADALREAANGPNDLLDAMDRLSKRLREKAGESVASLKSSRPLPVVTTASLEALQHYAAGVGWIDALSPAEASREFDKALAIDSTFASAWAGLSVALANMGVRQADRDHATERAFVMRGNLAPVERLRVDARYHNARGESTEEEAAYRALLAIDSTNGAALNNLGIILTRRSQYAEAEALFKRSLRARPDAMVPLDNLYKSAVSQSDTALLDSLRRALPPEPARRVAVWRFELSQAYGAGDYQRVERLVDSLSPLSADINRVAPLLLVKVQTYVTRGRLRGARAVFFDTLLPRIPPPAPPTLALDFELAMATAHATILDDAAGARAALARLERMAAPLERADQRLLERAWTSARVGDLAGARRLLQAAGPLLPRDTALATAVQGELAMAERRYADAVRSFKGVVASFALACATCGPAALARAYDAMGMRDSVVTLYERFLANHEPDTRATSDEFERARALKRLGELYEEKQQVALALQRYREFVELWRDADAELQPIVQDVRDRIARLEQNRG